MLSDVTVYEWVGEKDACVGFNGDSPLVGLEVETFTVIEVVLKVVSIKVVKHKKTCSDNQHAFTLFAFDIFSFTHHRLLTFYIKFKGLSISMSYFLSPRILCLRRLILPSKKPSDAVYCPLAFYSCVIILDI